MKRTYVLVGLWESVGSHAGGTTAQIARPIDCVYIYVVLTFGGPVGATTRKLLTVVDVETFDNNSVPRQTALWDLLPQVACTRDSHPRTPRHYEFGNSLASIF